jgi:ElaB/YqjD/DUF883 family membrane-anchored ribosome-binding protein
VTDERERINKTDRTTPFLIGIGIGLGALLGIALARRSVQKNHQEMVETVEHLRWRTQQVLNELSENVKELKSQTHAPGAESPS